MEDIKTKFGKQIRQIRQNMGISQEELAERAKLHRTYIGAVERGERNISLVNIIKISKALHVLPEELFKSIK